MAAIENLRALTGRHRRKAPMRTSALDLRQLLRTPSARKWIHYLAKAVALLGAFFLIGYFAPRMPAFVVAVLWALMTAVSTVGFVYLATVRKTLKQNKYEPGGWNARLTNGRILAILVGFVISAIFTAGLFFEIPRWNAADWGLMALSIPLYAGVSLAAARILRNEFRPLYRSGGVARASYFATGILLCLLGMLVSWLAPEPGFSSILEAQQAASQAFVGSPSLLMYDLGNLAALSDAITQYGVSLAAQTNGLVYVVMRLVVYASIFFGIANLLSLCYLDVHELRRAFAPLATEDNPNERAPLTRRFVVTAVVLPLCLAGAFMAADHQVVRMEESGEYSAMKNAVRDYLGLTVYAVDGKYYAPATVEQAVSDVRQQADALSQEARETLADNIGKAMKAREDNIDGYLTWYFGLSDDYLRQNAGDDAEAYVAQTFSKELNKNAEDEDSALLGKLSEYSSRAVQLQAEAVQKLAGHELTHLPEWLVKTELPYDEGFLEECLGSTRSLLGASELLDVNSETGYNENAISESILERAKDAEFYTKLVERVNEELKDRDFLQQIGHNVGKAVSSVFGTAERERLEGVYREEIESIIQEERESLLALVG